MNLSLKLDKILFEWLGEPVDVSMIVDEVMDIVQNPNVGEEGPNEYSNDLADWMTKSRSGHGWMIIGKTYELTRSTVVKTKKYGIQEVEIKIKVRIPTNKSPDAINIVRDLYGDLYAVQGEAEFEVDEEDPADLFEGSCVQLNIGISHEGLRHLAGLRREIEYTLDHELGHIIRGDVQVRPPEDVSALGYIRHGSELDPNIYALVGIYNRLPEERKKTITYKNLIAMVPELWRRAFKSGKWYRRIIQRLAREGIYLRP